MLKLGQHNMQYAEERIRLNTRGCRGLNTGRGMKYEKGHKANCFSSSNSVMDLLVLVVDKCITIC